MVDLSDTPITALHGVGKVLAAAYAKLGIVTVSDLLLHYPRSYENRGDIKRLCDTLPGEKQATLLTVGTAPRVTLLRRGISILRFRAFDESGTCEITYFNQNYLRETFEVGAEYRFYGKVERSGKRFSMSSPVYEEMREGSALPSLVPVYPLSEGLSQNKVKTHIAEALSLAAASLADPLPEDIRLAEKMPTLLTALRGIHTPTSFAELGTSIRRLCFDEVFLFALALRESATRQKATNAPVCPASDLTALRALLPFRLTRGQENAIGEIARDMARETPMNRILVGDVGCGKTVCAAAAMTVAVKSGFTAVLMAPTEILARQHFADLAPLFEKLGIRAELLIGSLTEKQKTVARCAMADGKCDILIGTQAVLVDKVELPRLGLVVIDEQHRFGVDQRSRLTMKGSHPHTLVMSATPIPRSFALTVWGGLDITRIEEIPPGRQAVDTFFVNEGYRERLNRFIGKQVAEGGQVYIVCPAVEEIPEEDGDLSLEEIGTFLASEPKTPLKSAVEYAKVLTDVFPEYRVAFVHGKMKGAEKDSVMRDFAAGAIQILVSTTVIEVGVNVPNACLMIVENADRFGLSQLHQLRGRVGRGSRKSYCVLVSDTKGERARERLETMCRTHDGYKIAEKDLALRGPGDFLRSSAASSFRQSGVLRFRLADLCGDDDTVSRAFAAAESLFAGGSTLRDFPLLSARLSRMFAAGSDTVN